MKATSRTIDGFCKESIGALRFPVYGSFYIVNHGEKGYLITKNKYESLDRVKHHIGLNKPGDTYTNGRDLIVEWKDSRGVIFDITELYD